jgi:hypothetical protein
MVNFMTSALLPHANDETGVCCPHAQGVSRVLTGDVRCAQLLLDTIANDSSREHHVAICTATNCLRHLHVGVVYPFRDCACSECLPFLLPPRFFFVLIRGGSLNRRLLTDFPFSERIAVLVASHPGDDREAVRSFAVLYDVRRFDIVYIPTIFDVVSSNAPPPQRDGHHATFISTLTIPMDVMNTHTRDAQVGDDASCSEAVAEENGATKTVGFAV